MYAKSHLKIKATDWSMQLTVIPLGGCKTMTELFHIITARFCWKWINNNIKLPSSFFRTTYYCQQASLPLFPLYIWIPIVADLRVLHTNHNLMQQCKNYSEQIKNYTSETNNKLSVDPRMTCPVSRLRLRLWRIWVTSMSVVFTTS